MNVNVGHLYAVPCVSSLLATWSEIGNYRVRATELVLVREGADLAANDRSTVRAL